jgi:TolB-like protein/Flp pilus assembly protein TadD
MELLEGESLRTRIPAAGMGWQRTTEIGAAVADGLAAAHAKAIVHRDLKPENIFQTADGRIKILDFGLAQFTEPVFEDAETATLTPAGTAPGKVMGTVGYMAPEQVRGEPADGRSDIFAVGCVLYEMLTGRRAFGRDTAAETMTAILREEPEALVDSGLSIPIELDRGIRRCLEKSPEARFQSAADLAFALRAIASQPSAHVTPSASRDRRPSDRRLWRVAAAAAVAAAVAIGGWIIRRPPADPPPTTVTARIVVLPFENLGEPDDVYFADGMTEEITARIASVGSLQVISRTSATQYADTDKTIQEMGAELGVSYVLEGTVRWARGDGESRIRITPQLIRVSDDTHLWAQTYDRVLDDIFDVQSEIALKVAQELGVALAGGEKGGGDPRPTENLEAYQAYLRGRYWISRPHFTFKNWERAMQSFQRAADLDPGFALAHAELARLHAVAHYLRHDLTPERIMLADSAATRALELARDNPRVHLYLGYYRLWGHHDIEGALREFEIAGGGASHDVDVLAAIGDVHIVQGRWEDALEVFQRGFALSPRDVSLLTRAIWAMHTLRRYPEAMAACDEAISLAPDTMWPYLYKALTFWGWYGDVAETRQVIEAMPESSGDWRRWSRYWQAVYEGQYEEALAHAEASDDGWLRLKMFARPNVLLAAFAYHWRGDAPAAAENFERARELLEAAVEASPEDPRLHSSLGIVYALLGRSEEAIQAGRLACELLPQSKDGFYYLPFVVDLAHIYTILGDEEAALERLDHLLSNPSYLSAPFLRMDPRWDSLEANPEYQALLATHEIKP